MGYLRLTATALAAVVCMVADASEQEGNDEKIFTGSAYTEVNYGHKYYGEERTLWDFPHIVLSGELRLGKGWTVTAEF